MKTKLKIILILLASVLICNAQVDDKLLGISMGVNSVNPQLTGISPNCGISMGIDVDWFHFHVTSNINENNGDYLEFNSDETDLTDKISWSIVSVGFNQRIFNDKINTLFIRPRVGVLMTNSIYEDDILFPTYYTERLNNYFTLSCDLVYLTQSNFYISFGYSITKQEQMMLHLGYSF